MMKDARSLPNPDRGHLGEEVWNAMVTSGSALQNDRRAFEKKDVLSFFLQDLEPKIGWRSPVDLSGHPSDFGISKICVAV